MIGFSENVAAATFTWNRNVRRSEAKHPRDRLSSNNFPVAKSFVPAAHPQLCVPILERYVAWIPPQVKVGTLERNKLLKKQLLGNSSVGV